MKLATALITIFTACMAAERTYREVGLNYYHEYHNGYGGSVCDLQRDLTFKELQDIDPDVKCTEKEKTMCHPFGGCRAVGYEVNCMIGDAKHPAPCDKVQRVCAVSMLGKLQYGTCVKIHYDPGDCCYKLEDSHTGYWTKDRKGKCPFLCFGVVSLPGAQWCKTCSCDNPESGTGQGGSKSYGSLC
ncbi:unnamed protein product [Umbelopsis sp. WA50703]|jgi:hypothetical protein